MDLVFLTNRDCELDKQPVFYCWSIWTCGGLETFSVDLLKFLELFWASWAALFIISISLVSRTNKVKQLISECASIILQKEPFTLGKCHDAWCPKVTRVASQDRGPYFKNRMKNSCILNLGCIRVCLWWLVAGLKVKLTVSKVDNLAC